MKKVYRILSALIICLSILSSLVSAADNFELEGRLSEDFEDGLGNWNCALSQGMAATAETDYGNSLCLSMNKQAQSDKEPVAYRAFSPITDNILFELDVMCTTRLAQAAVQIAGSASVPVINFRPNGNISTTLSNWGEGVVLGQYEPEKWYHVKMEILVNEGEKGVENITVTDMESGEEMKAENVPLMNKVSNVNAIKLNLWSSPMNKPVEIYYDNISVSRIVYLPTVTDIYASVGDTSYAKDNIAHDANTINIVFSHDINPETLTKDTVVLSADYDGIYDTSERTYSMTLKEEAGYGNEFLLSLKDGITDLKGKNLVWDEDIILKTEPEPFHAQNISFKRGDAVISSLSELYEGDTVTLSYDMVNNSEEKKEMSVLLAFYDAACTMQSVSLNKISANAGETLSGQTQDLSIASVPEGGMLRVMFIDNLENMQITGRSLELN